MPAGEEVSDEAARRIYLSGRTATGDVMLGDRVLVRDEVVHERVYREGDHRDREERRERRPGIELNVPGVSIEGH